MMGPDYTHWHGTYELARNFYSEYIPELTELAERNLGSQDPARAAAAKKLHDTIESVLSTENHQWFLGQMDPEEAARRAKAAEDFRSRYDK